MEPGSAGNFTGLPPGPMLLRSLALGRVPGESTLTSESWLTLVVAVLMDFRSSRAAADGVAMAVKKSLLLLFRSFSFASLAFFLRAWSSRFACRLAYSIALSSFSKSFVWLIMSLFAASMSVVILRASSLINKPWIALKLIWDGSEFSVPCSTACYERAC